MPRFSPTSEEVFYAGYCTDSERAEALRDELEGRGIDTAKFSIRDSLDDSKVYTRFTAGSVGQRAKERRQVVAVEPGNAGEVDFTAKEMSEFNKFAWNQAKHDYFKSRWCCSDQECILVDWEWIDRRLL